MSTYFSYDICCLLDKNKSYGFIYEIINTNQWEVIDLVFLQIVSQDRWRWRHTSKVGSTVSVQFLLQKV